MRDRDCIRRDSNTQLINSTTQILILRRKQLGCCFVACVYVKGCSLKKNKYFFFKHLTDQCTLYTIAYAGGNILLSVISS